MAPIRLERLVAVRVIFTAPKDFRISPGMKEKQAWVLYCGSQSVANCKLPAGMPGRLQLINHCDGKDPAVGVYSEF